MFRKSVALFMIVVCTLVCLPVFSSASQNITQYAGIPRPVPNGNTKFIAVQNRERTEGYLYMITLPSIIFENEDYLLTVAPSDSTHLYLYFYGVNVAPDIDIFKFDLNGDFLEHFRQTTIMNTEIAILELVSPDVVYIDTFGIFINDPYNKFSWGTPSIAWNDSVDPEVYTSWLSQIYSKLGEIDINTDNIESQLTSISSQLTLFYNIFNSYQMQQHSDLVNIYNKVIDIYNLLSEEQETYAPVEQGSQIDQFIQAESALNKDFSGDLQNQFNTAGNIFTGNSAFAFISNTFQDLILSNMSLNSLIIFALAIGLCVFVLGRRLNA